MTMTWMATFASLVVIQIAFTSMIQAKMSVDVAVFGKDVTYIEEDLPQWMSETQKLYRNKSRENILEFVSNELLIDNSSAAAVLLSKMLKSLPKHSTSKTGRSLQKCIESEVDRKIFSEKINSMKSAVETVIERLETITTGKRIDAATVVNDIGIELSEIIDEFTATTSEFRHYPELIADSFLTIATVYNQFYPIFRTTMEPNSNAKILPCKIASALEDYRYFYTAWRLSRLRSKYVEYGRTIYPGIKCSAQLNDLGQVLHEPFDRNGYTTDLSTFCWAKDGYACSEDCKRCIVDILDDRQYETNCFKDFMLLVRHKIEKFFQQSIDMSTELCMKFEVEYFTLPKYPTGFGWLLIRNQLFLISSTSDYSYENLFATIAVNETEVLRTPTDPDYSQRFIDVTYTTGRIDKTTRIGMIVYEQKSDSDDEFLTDRSIPVDLILKRGSTSEYFLCEVAIWRDEFSSDLLMDTTESSVL